MQRWIVVLGLGLVVAGLGAAPAEAGVYHHWQFDSRPSGQPTSTVAAQTLVSASADSETEFTSTTFDAEVVLGGVPDDLTRSYLQIALGVVEDGTCRMDWQLSVPTDRPGGPATRDGAVLSVSAVLPPLDEEADRCGWVQLSAADGTVLDRLDAPLADTAFIDPGGAIRIQAVDGLRVRPHHWERLWVQVRYSGAPAQSVRASGEGHGVDVRTTRQRIRLHDGDDGWVPLWVRLKRAEPVRLNVSAIPLGDGLAFSGAGHRTVTLRPAR